MSGRDFKVASLNVSRSEPIITKLDDCAGLKSFHSLTRADTTHLRIFKRCQKPGQDGAGPRDIIVCHDNDGSLHLWNRLADLDPLVCDRDMEDSDICRLQRLDKGNELLVFVGSRDQEELIRAARENALDGLPQLVEVIVNCRDDNRDVLGRIRRLRRDREGFVAPMTEKVDDGAEVAVEPEKAPDNLGPGENSNEQHVDEWGLVRRPGGVERVGRSTST